MLSNRKQLLPFRRWTDITRALLPFAKRHRGFFIRGSLMALFLIALRLALPWPLKAILKPVLDSDQSTVAALQAGVVLLVLLVLLGFADFLGRLNFARFSIALVRDLRSEALRSVLRGDHGLKTSDIIVRMTADISRIKAGLKGFLIHVMPNGILVLGSTAVMFWIDARLGIPFAVAAVLIGAGTTLAAARIFLRLSKRRVKESKLASAIEDAVSGPMPRAIGDKVADPNASVTRLQGLATWWAYAMYGAAMLCAIIASVGAVRRGEISAEDLLVFLVYGAMLRAPIARLARQGARTGKILAYCERLQVLLVTEAQPSFRRLEHSLTLRDVLVTGDKGRRTVLGPISLEITAGERIALVGPQASGKSLLLSVLTGQRPAKGSVHWDAEALATIPSRARAEQIGHLSQAPTWGRQRLREYLGVRELSPVLVALGLASIVASLRKGLKTRVSSAELSSGERKAIALGRLASRRASVFLLDDPIGSMPREDGARALHALFAAHPTATFVVALPALMAPPLLGPLLGAFDRVLTLQEGQVVADSKTPLVKIVGGIL